MKSKERVLAAWNGQATDHVPLTTWCFGVPAPEHLRWQTDGCEVKYWYTKRLEHIHTLPQTWDLEDDFNRVLAWGSLGVDDILDVSVPWSVDPEVTWEDTILPESAEREHPVAVREYQTPAGNLRHEVRLTGEDPGPGWVIQPEHVPLFEDYNVPRAAKHAVSNPQEIPIIRHLYQAPDPAAWDWFAARMDAVRPFAEEHDVPVQAWAAFGMDGVVWITGAMDAIMMAMQEPRAFAELVEIVHAADLGRTELAASSLGVDMIVERGWYSGTGLWSPKLFDTFVFPYVEELVSVAHKRGKKFGYVMTTGVELLGPRLADAGVDVLYFVDPVQDKLSLETTRDLLGDRLTLVGGTNALTLASGAPDRIRDEVRRAIEVLGPTNRFILHPVDALFPDTPWSGVEVLIEAWREFQ